MDIKNLTEGQVLKNYKELCGALNIPIKSGNTKKAQIKDLECYVKYHKQGNGFVIDEIYKNPLEKVDNRIDGNNAKYAEYIDSLLLHMCSETFDSKYNYITLSTNGILLALNMVNANYRTGRNMINQFSRYLEIPIETIRDFYDSTYKRNKKLLESALNRLAKKSLISWNIVVKVCTKDGDHRLATDGEIEGFLEIEQEILKKLGMDNKQEVFLYGKWNEFSKEVNKMLCELTNFRYYYNAYKIITTKAFRKMLLDESDKESSENELNSKLYFANIKSATNRHDKIAEEYKASATLMGKKKMPQWDKDCNRLTENYIEDSKRIANVIIDNNTDYDLEKQLKDITNKKFSYETSIWKNFYEGDLEMAELFKDSDTFEDVFG
jgi:hypothetical protein